MSTGKHLRFIEWLTLAKLQLAKAGIENAQVDANYLLSYITKIPHLNLFLHANQTLSTSQLKRLNILLERRLKREPLQYIMKSVDFHGLSLHVNKNVLIPRFETELLVDMIISENHSPGSILDIGTGSGAIALALKQAYPEAKVMGVDISVSALRMAVANARRLKLNAAFKKSDVYSTVSGQFDIIVSNPPYLTAEEFIATAPEVQSYEPVLALKAEDNGLEVYQKILKHAHEHLIAQGKIYLEIGYMQADSISFLAQKSGFTSMEKRQDLNGFDRYFIIRK